MTDDRRLDELLDDAARSYRVPPEAPLDAMWERIECEAFAEQPARRRAIGWPAYTAAAAAILVLGVALGRYTAPGAAVTPAAVAAATPVAFASGSDPYHQATEEFLGRTAVLLTALHANGAAAQNEALAPQAAQLLMTTRLLLDSPVATDPQMKNLLQDLELLLAQVARMQTPRRRAELTLITDALEERDLVPRVRSAVADLAANEY
jgi:hypothetical protein